MSQLHSNLLKLLLSKKQLKLSSIKARRLREALRRLHEEAAGEGHEAPSYFGVPLHLQQQSTSSLISSPVPHILEAITSYLLIHASQEGILRKSGSERRASALKDLIEANNGEVPPAGGQHLQYSVHDVTCVLKRWFRALPEPVVPRILHEVFSKCVQLESHHHRTQSLLLACLLMPAFHLNTLKHVAHFLQEISKLDSKNKMSSTNLAKVLAPSLMPRINKTESNPDAAARFSEKATTAIQVLIDHAQLIGSMPSELEPIKDVYRLSSEDDLSDHGELHVKRKLFTFLKPKNTGHKVFRRGSLAMRSSRRFSPSAMALPAAGVVAQSLGPRITEQTLDSDFDHSLFEFSYRKQEAVRPNAQSQVKLAASERAQPRRSEKRPHSLPGFTPSGNRASTAVIVSVTACAVSTCDMRLTRNGSRKQQRQLSAETVVRIRERRALRAIQNTRSQPSVRSLPPALVSSGGRRRSVRRSATCRVATVRSLMGSSGKNCASGPVDCPVAAADENEENVVNISQGAKILSYPSLSESVQSEPLKSTKAAFKQAPEGSLKDSARRDNIDYNSLSESRKKSSSSPVVDKETARRSFLAAMLGVQEELDIKQANTKLMRDAASQCSLDATHVPAEPKRVTQLRQANTSNCCANSDGDFEPALERRGALRKPFMPSSRRIAKKDQSVACSVTANVTVQL